MIAEEIREHFRLHHMSMWAHHLIQFGFRDEINSFDDASLRTLAPMMPYHANIAITKELREVRGVEC